MINNRTFEHRPISELTSIVKRDLKKLNDEGLIDEGALIKTIMHCNDKLGIPIREVREVALPVIDYKAKVPIDLEKFYFICALEESGSITHDFTNPFDNSIDTDVVYEAGLTRDQLGGVTNYNVTVKRLSTTTIHHHGNWVQLEMAPSSKHLCHISCPNTRKKGKYQIEVVDETIHTPFRSGTLYLMYIGAMKDSDGNLLFPFHPLITPYYEWSLKEKVLLDAIFNSEGSYGELLKLAQVEKTKAWLDAFNITLEKGYGEYVDMQRKKELRWYNQYFKAFQ